MVTAKSGGFRGGVEIIKKKKKKIAPFLKQNTSCERGGERWLERKKWVTMVARL